MYCYCAEVVCSDLFLLANGNITYTAGSINNRPIGTVALYSCASHYIFSGGSNKTCESDGEWSGSVVICQGTECFSKER